MISDAALKEFKEIWLKEFGLEISDSEATDEAVNLLTVFNAVYRPIKEEWANEYDGRTNTLENQPISTSCKSGAARR